MDCAAAGGWEKVITLLIAAGAEIDPIDKSKVQILTCCKSVSCALACCYATGFTTCIYVPL